MKGICYHCNTYGKVKKIGSYDLCKDHKSLKQYQPKDRSPKPLKRTELKKSNKPINKISKRQAIALDLYKPICLMFKAMNSYCSAKTEECTGLTDDIHHMQGKVGFTDDWAKKNNIPALIDMRHFLPVCRKCHHKIEMNPNWAKEQGFSLNRLQK